MGIEIDDNKCDKQDIREKLLEVINSDFEEKFKQGKRKQLEFSFCDDDLFYGVKCPSCKNLFGISQKILDKNININYIYTCPYCGFQKGLEKD